MDKTIDKALKEKQEKDENLACIVGAISFLIILINIVFFLEFINKDNSIMLYLTNYPVGSGIVGYIILIFLYVFLKNPQGFIHTIIDYCMLFVKHRFLMVPFFVSPFIMLYLEQGIETVGITLLVIVTAPFVITVLWGLFCFSLAAKGAPITIATRIAKGEKIDKEGFVEESIGYGIAVTTLKDTLKK